jgi:hypothetical protein
MPEETATPSPTLEQRLQIAEMRIKQLENTLYDRVVSQVEEGMALVEDTRKNLIQEMLDNRTYLDQRVASALKSIDETSDAAVNRVHQVIDRISENTAIALRKSLVDNTDSNVLDQILRRVLGSAVVKTRPATQNEIASGDSSVVATRLVSR